MFNRQRPEYKIWAGIVQRCRNPNSPNYNRYGAVGIDICDEWRSSFQKFFDHLGSRPSHDHSVDRIDGSKGYCPGNVRWATRREQEQNKARTIWMTYRGETRCLSEWSHHLGLPVVTLFNRLERGWSDERALSTPCSGRGTSTRKLTQDQAEEIRAARVSGIRGIDLAVKYGVTPNIISRICTGKTYAFDRAIDAAGGSNGE